MKSSKKPFLQRNKMTKIPQRKIKEPKRALRRKERTLLGSVRKKRV